MQKSDHMKRKIITIDENRCTGCGQCIPNCPEGALQVIDGKARIINDLFCDGLGACIGHCPEGAISIEEREAEEYDERRVMENVIKQGENVIEAHLKHLKDHNQHGYLQEAVAFLKERGMAVPLREPALLCGCPGESVKDFSKEHRIQSVPSVSQLRQWPVQFMLVPPHASFLKDADLLIASDCVPCAYGGFHTLLTGKIVLVGCPKFDDSALYRKKLLDILKNNTISSITVAIMEVPCCFGLYQLVLEAVKESKKGIPVKKYIVTIKGELQAE